MKTPPESKLVRNSITAPAAQAIRQHDNAVARAFGWFLATTDLGWLKRRAPVLH